MIVRAAAMLSECLKLMPALHLLTTVSQSPCSEGAYSGRRRRRLLDCTPTTTGVVLLTYTLA